MEEKYREAFRLHSLDIRYLRRLEESKRIIAFVLKYYKKPYIAFSGGKDSTVLTHLIVAVNPEIMVFHWDYGCFYILEKVQCEIMGNASKLGVINFRVETSDLYNKLGRKAINILGREMLGKVSPRLKREGYDSVFVGLRKEESLKRKRRINMNRSLTKIKEFWPLSEWSWLDIWAYIVSNSLPYLSHYDLYGPIIGWDKVRMITFFDSEFDFLGSSNIDGVLMWRFKNL